MFTFDPVIDAIQSSKKSFVNTFITNEKIAKSLNDYVDSQTAYTKEAMNATTTMVTAVMSETTKGMQDLTKFDYTKFGEGMMKGWLNNVNKK
jgi:hypothetical protein